MRGLLVRASGLRPAPVSSQAICLCACDFWIEFERLLVITGAAISASATAAPKGYTTPRSKLPVRALIARSSAKPRCFQCSLEAAGPARGSFRLRGSCRSRSRPSARSAAIGLRT